LNTGAFAVAAWPGDEFTTVATSSCCDGLEIVCPLARDAAKISMIADNSPEPKMFLKLLAIMNPPFTCK
jgi:hypothetical protein